MSKIAKIEPMSSISLTIKATNGDKYAVESNKAGTVAELKQALEAKSSIAASLQRLIYKGKSSWTT